MADRLIYPCGRISRRKFLFQTGVGFFGTAMGALWAEEGKLREAQTVPHFAARAHSVIFLFMCGGVSLDTFDPKDNKWAGRSSTPSAWTICGDETPVIPCADVYAPRQIRHPVSDWFPGRSDDEPRALDVVSRNKPFPRRWKWLPASEPDCRHPCWEAGYLRAG
jgi:hypothetical protein